MEPARKIAPPRGPVAFHRKLGDAAPSRRPTSAIRTARRSAPRRAALHEYDFRTLAPVTYRPPEVECRSRIRPSTSLTVFGNAPDRLRTPSASITNESSMRTPMSLYFVTAAWI